MNWPNPMTGVGALAHWCNRLLEACKRRQLVPGPGYRLHQMAGGQALEILARPGGGTAGAASPAPAASGPQRFRVKADFGAYLLCAIWDGTTEGQGITLISAAVASGGTGYAVGDLLTIYAGVAGVQAVLRVAAISGGGGTGPVTAVTVSNPGSYSIPPISPAGVYTGAATFNLTWNAVAVTSVVIDSGGTGYSVGDILTLAGGTGTAATAKVTAISGGGGTGPITGIVLKTQGLYSVLPISANSPTGGSGASASLLLTFGQPLIFVAKVPELRWSLAGWTETIEGVSTSFAHAARTNNDDGQRTVTTLGGSPQTEIVLRIWQKAAAGSGVAGGYDEIWADTPIGGTGVVGDGAALGCPDGQEITLLDDNRAGRAWCQIG